MAIKGAQTTKGRGYGCGITFYSLLKFVLYSIFAVNIGDKLDGG